MAPLFTALLGIYMTGCTLIFTVWGFQRLVGKRRPNLRIQALEDRISQLEVAVAMARRDLQPQDESQAKSSASRQPAAEQVRDDPEELIQEKQERELDR